MYQQGGPSSCNNKHHQGGLVKSCQLARYKKDIWLQNNAWISWQRFRPGKEPLYASKARDFFSAIIRVLFVLCLNILATWPIDIVGLC